MVRIPDVTTFCVGCFKKNWISWQTRNVLFKIKQNLRPKSVLYLNVPFGEQWWNVSAKTISWGQQLPVNYINVNERVQTKHEWMIKLDIVDDKLYEVISYFSITENLNLRYIFLQMEDNLQWRKHWSEKKSALHHF